jgi:hypothetical protein
MSTDGMIHRMDGVDCVAALQQENAELKKRLQQATRLLTDWADDGHLHDEYVKFMAPLPEEL